MIKLQVLVEDQPRPHQISTDDISTVIADPNKLLWIDLTDPTSDDVALLAREFSFHPLALEDAQSFHQRPKLDQYDTFLFLVFYAVSADEAGEFQTTELSLFVGANYLVTVHRGDCPEIAQTAARWKENISQLSARRVAVLLYSLLDTIVDNYFPVLDAVADRVDELEEGIFDNRAEPARQEIFVMRKRLLALRRVLGPERDLMANLTRRDIELLGPDTAVYFQDVYDHLLRVIDSLETYRDLLSSALEAYLSGVSNNLNQVMRTLTSWSIILMTLALIAGIYGMNFDNMPELHLHWGYYGSLTGMLILGALLFALFKKIRWL